MPDSDSPPKRSQKEIQRRANRRRTVWAIVLCGIFLVGLIGGSLGIRWWRLNTPDRITERMYWVPDQLFYDRADPFAAPYQRTPGTIAFSKHFNAFARDAGHENLTLGDPFQSEESANLVAPLAQRTLQACDIHFPAGTWVELSDDRSYLVVRQENRVHQILQMELSFGEVSRKPSIMNEKIRNLLAAFRLTDPYDPFAASYDPFGGF